MVLELPLGLLFRQLIPVHPNNQLPRQKDIINEGALEKKKWTCHRTHGRGADYEEVNLRRLP
jgi:hypothetical protein